MSPMLLLLLKKGNVRLEEKSILIYTHLDHNIVTRIMVLLPLAKTETYFAPAIVRCLLPNTPQSVLRCYCRFP